MNQEATIKRLVSMENAAATVIAFAQNLIKESTQLRIELMEGVSTPSLRRGPKLDPEQRAKVIAKMNKTLFKKPIKKPCGNKAHS